MLLSAIQSVFHSKLHPLYPKQEIDNVFKLVVDDLLNYSKIEIHQNLHKNILPETEKKMQIILERLANAEPIQYILGRTEFYGLPLTSDKRALIPRPETEILVDSVVKEHTPKNNLTILDIGTGSGCIAIALAKSFPDCYITAIDNSKEALDLAQINAELNTVEIDFINDNILDPRADYSLLDIIISNPPYVRNSEKQYMHRNILEFEPENALYVTDDDPLIFYKAIAGFSKKHLHPQGSIYLELNEFLGKEIEELYSISGFRDIKLNKDLNQKYRYLTARK